MNKKSIITILLALVTLAGQAQVKSGLDLCLRNETTGEWLIGLFDDYAIYDCEYWDYAEVRKGRLVLTKDGLCKEIRLKKNAITIDGVKHKTSVLTTKFLPDYPTKDETPFDDRIADDEAESTIRIVTRSGKPGTEFTCHFNTCFADDNEDEPREYTTDSLGRLEFHLQLYMQSVITVMCYDPSSSKWLTIEFTLYPKQTALLYVDDVEGRFYVMGAGARFTNELLAHPFSGNTPIDEEWRALETTEHGAHTIGFENYVAFTERRTSYLMAHLDSVIVAHPQLSRRWKDYRHELCRYGQAFDVFCDYSNNLSSSLSKTFMDVAEKHDWFHPLVPINCSAFALPVFMRLSCVMPIPERYAYQSGDPLRQRLDALDSIALSPVNRELYATQYFLEWIDALSSPLSASQMEYLPQFVHSPYLLNRIQKKNMEFIAYVEAARASRDKSPLAGTPASLRVAESELEGLTDGREIFERIIAPFRGRIVYVDVWGTWCGPCKRQMEYVPAVKEALADKPIVYLYFCNQSSEEAWLVNREHYHLNADNCIHYNLPEAQEDAIEKFLGVHEYPSYRLFDRQGRIVPPGYAPYPSDLEELKVAVEKALSIE